MIFLFYFFQSCSQSVLAYRAKSNSSIVLHCITSHHTASHRITSFPSHKWMQYVKLFVFLVLLLRSYCMNSIQRDVHWWTSPWVADWKRTTAKTDSYNFDGHKKRKTAKSIREEYFPLLFSSIFFFFFNARNCIQTVFSRPFDWIFEAGGGLITRITYRLMVRYW